MQECPGLIWRHKSQEKYIRDVYIQNVTCFQVAIHTFLDFAQRQDNGVTFDRIFLFREDLGYLPGLDEATGMLSNI